ncbi:acyl-CoA dehydrogenase family protein [Pseudoroseomonas wenyumeiae]
MDQMMTESDPHADLREEVAKLCARFPGEYWRKLDEVRGYPTEFVQALTEAGYLGALIPEEYGGAGLGLSAAAAILEEVQRQGCNGAACHAQMYIMGTILRHGSVAQKQEYLPKIASGELRLQAFGVTEPTSGTDTTALRTFARREGDKYIVNGQKIWTSRAEHSDLMLLLARTTPRDQVAKKTEGLSTFIVDMRKVLGKGLTIRPIRTMMNHNSCEVFFDNMEVPAENLVGEEGKGFRYILDGMNAERLLIASECIGDAKWFIEKAVNYAKERVLFGRPIGQNQGVQFPIARAYAQMRAAEAIVQKGLEKFERGERPGEEANMGKMLAAEASWAAGEACVQTHGGFGFAEEYDVERKFRETRLYQVAPISTNLILSYLGEHVLGMPRSY